MKLLSAFSALVSLVVSLPAGAQTSDQFLSATGASGALSIPNGKVLADGELAFALNNFREPTFTSFHRGENYLFGIGFFDVVELSARLANYPLTTQGGLGLRDLGASIKVAVPKVVRGQPNIVLGINDVSGGAVTFRNQYVSVSEDFGRVRATIGAASGGGYLDGLFGSLEVPIGRTGISAIVERTGQANLVGMRYVSRPTKWLLNGQMAFDIQRTIKTTGANGLPFDRTSANLQFVLPLGRNAANPRRVPDEMEPIWTPPPASRPQVDVGPAIGASGAGSSLVVAQVQAVRETDLSVIAARVRAAGLERVRVGRRGSELVIQFENTRYMTNEVDAFGIALGIGSLVANDDVRTVVAVGTKLGLPVASVSVSRDSYRSFLRTAATGDLRDELGVQQSPALSGVEWHSEASRRTLAQLRIQPRLVKFVGTEVGVFDYSLAADIQLHVPLWKGAVAKVSQIATIHESDDVAHGIFGLSQQPNDVRSATISQAFWLLPRLLNVTTVGKFLYNEKGVQNELTYFAPYRDDQIRLHVNRMEQPQPFKAEKRTYNTGGINYLMPFDSLNGSIELGYNVYRLKDRGPTVQINRWIGDVQAQIFMRRGAETRIGFGLAFPLTPRQGMRPGWVQLQGTNNYPFRVETKYASAGECNCINGSVLDEFPLVYGARAEFLNLGRISREYFIGQLQRMREAQMIYAPISN